MHGEATYCLAISGPVGIATGRCFWELGIEGKSTQSCSARTRHRLAFTALSLVPLVRVPKRAPFRESKGPEAVNSALPRKVALLHFCLRHRLPDLRAALRPKRQVHPPQRCIGASG